ncbi:MULTISPECIES: GNAT family N-acetyltransferase [Sutcliffiella]|uniref:GNAT family N-acetyltransferase n=1 Tax=Sutcliffiella TaxID=2837511 RepID=UPI0022DD9012|nr:MULTISPECIES: GNAT family N-acetyltransferase [Sutcliffiella]MED4016970.1 GNAT family N-acetyltransferase [Sutcliffiella cohnii]WBL16335.1 GNAT family N-acetyltransferase [Sutcliffiella sp. NC1]
MTIHYESMKSLSEDQYLEVVQLLKKCENHDKLEIASSINVSMISKADEPHLFFIMAYDRTELVGFVGLYTFVDVTKVEIAGMVAPAYRRKGIFSTLLEKALTVCAERKVDEILFVCPEKSVEAKGLMKKLGAVYSFSEYTMEYDDSYNKKQLESLRLEKATSSDVPTITQLLLDGFGFGEDPKQVEPLLTRNITQDGYEVYIVKKDEKVFATLTISNEGTSMYISAFTVSFEERGKGYGKKILQAAVELIRKKDQSKPIRLDVDVSNENALSLYEGVGFRTISGYDYYLNM